MSKAKAKELLDLVNGTLKTNALTMASDPQYTVTFTSTGVLPYDILLQGGVPRGRFIELYGDYSTLKSYIGLMSIVQFQKAGKVCAVIDTEHSFDEAWAVSCGVDTDSLIVHRPASGEEGMDICEVLIRGGVDLIVFDSIAAMTPQAEQEKRLAGENIQPARIAMLMSAALRRLTTANIDTSMIWINQTRVNIGITFGSNEANPGGKAMPFYASYRISSRKVGKVTVDKKVYDGEKWVNTKVITGQKFKAELTKSKLSKPFGEVLFTWDLTRGSLDLVGYLIAQGLELGIIELRGNTWSYGENKAVGREKFRKMLEADPDLILDMENEVRDAHGLPTVKRATVKTLKTSKAESTSPGKSARASKMVSSRKGSLRRK